jgi:hypothetical protein
MAHEAIINFLFNSEGAMREIDNFKSRFSKALDGLADSASNIGKVLGVGGGLATFFSAKDFMDHIRAIGDLNTLYNNLPIDKIGRFSNAMELLGASDEEAVASLKGLQDMMAKLEGPDGGQFIPLLQNIGVQPIDEATGKIKDAITLFMEIDESLRHGLGTALKDTQRTQLFEKLGLSGDSLTAVMRYVNQTDEELANLNKTLDKMWTPDESDVNRLRNFDKSLALLRNTFRKLGKTLIDLGLGNLIDNFNKAIGKFIELSPDTQKAIMYFIGALIMMKPALKTLEMMRDLLKLPSSLISPWLLFAGVYALVANNIGGSKDALEELLKKYNEWVKTLKDDHPFLAEFAKQIGDLFQAILHPIDTFIKAWNGLKKDWNSLFGNDNDVETLQPEVKEVYNAFVPEMETKTPISNSSSNSNNINVENAINVIVNGEMSETQGRQLGTNTGRYILETITNAAKNISGTNTVRIL